MFGVKYELIAFGASVCRMFGSLKSWKLPMMEKITPMTSAPRMAGSLMPVMMRNGPAPSSSAAS